MKNRGFFEGSHQSWVNYSNCNWVTNYFTVTFVIDNVASTFGQLLSTWYLPPKYQLHVTGQKVLCTWSVTLYLVLTSITLYLVWPSTTKYRPITLKVTFFQKFWDDERNFSASSVFVLQQKLASKRLNNYHKRMTIGFFWRQLWVLLRKKHFLLVNSGNL